MHRHLLHFPLAFIRLLLSWGLDVDSSEDLFKVLELFPQWNFALLPYLSSWGFRDDFYIFLLAILAVVALNYYLFDTF